MSAHGKRLRESQAAPAIVLAAIGTVGAALRVGYYVVNADFSNDEAHLALNLIDGTYGGLLQPLKYNQAAPIVFLVVEKLAAAVDRSEYALRLVPLVASLASLALFWPTLSRYVGRRAAAIGFAFFALSELSLTYAATAKQYATDVLVALVLYAITPPDGRNVPRSRLVALAAVGAAAVWVSHPAAFVEAAVGLVGIARGLAARRRRDIVQWAGVSGVWLASFSAFYLLTKDSYAHLQSSFANSPAAFGAVPGAGPSRLSVYGGTARALLGAPHFDVVLLRYAILAAVTGFVVVGMVALIRRRPAAAAMLILPVVVALCAALAGRYPIYPRTLLFFVPAALALVGYGAFVLLTDAHRAVTIAAACAASASVVAAAVPGVTYLWAPDAQDVKTAMRYVARHEQPGDSLYIYPGAQYDVRYYLECRCFGDAPTVSRAARLWPLRPAPGTTDEWSSALLSAPPRLVVGKSSGTEADDYRKDFAPLIGRPRVWVLVVAAQPASGKALFAFLDRAGRPIQKLERPQSVAVLYDMQSR